LVFAVFVGVNLACGEPATPPKQAKPATGNRTPAKLVATSGKVAAGDWPWWRGPDYNGVSSETKWRDDWSEAGPKILWRGSVGTGFSSFAVEGDRAYTMGHADGNDTVFCFNAETGETIWTHTYPCKLVDNLHEGGPGATPTIDGAQVYTVSKEGHFFCLDAASGKVLWQHEFQPLFEVKMPAWGFSASPVILGNQVIVEGGSLAAFDKTSGELIWKTEPQRHGYGTPTCFEHDGTTWVAWLSNDNLTIVNAADGSEADRFPWETQFATTAGTPLVQGDQIFISTGYNRGCALFTFDGEKLTDQYDVRTMRNHMAASVPWNDVLFGFDGNSHNRSSVHLKCIDWATGEEKWKHRGLGCGTVLRAGDRLIVLSDEGLLVVAPCSEEGFEPTAEAQVLEGRCWSVPVLARGLLYCRNAAGDVVCVDLRN
jgi:outer membrane protein assembly factor BamB